MRKKTFHLLAMLALCMAVVCSFSVTAFAYAEDTEQNLPVTEATQPEETPTQNTTTVTLIQTGTTDWLAAVLLIFGIGLLVCGWFFDRKQRAAKH